MHLIDWIFIAVPLLVVCLVAFFTQRHMKSVADFMSGGRLAGPYLLAVAGGELQAGAVMFVAGFEVIARSGFTLTWWGWLSIPVGVFVAVSGFVSYRFRETRAMTWSQFFELRYSKSFRVFTGFLGFFAGIINFGIIPAVGARCMVYFLGLPTHLDVFSLHIPTYMPLMALFLSVSLVMTLSGGVLTVMITDCVEGILSQLFYLVIIIALICMFSWTEINEVLVDRPPGHSLLNPFDSLANTDFNLWYVLMSIFVSVYGTSAWQNASAFKSASISPHASRMGGILGRWRESGKTAVLVLLAICAITYLKHPDFSAQAAVVQAEVAKIDQAQIQKQMEIPIALSHMLPVGVKGLLCAILLMGIFGGDSTHLHSWGGIFVQDILVPLRKKPFGAKQHIRALRMSIIGVAVFAFFFGCLFQQTEYIVMWWSVTMAIYVGGAGACIIGGLYWKKGTTAGAWTALLLGSSLSVLGILARQVWGDSFPLNGIQISFTATLTAIISYISVSFLTNRKDYDMDRLLHRGKYSAMIEKIGEQVDAAAPVARAKFSWKDLVGIDKNFTTGDKWIAGSLFAWSLGWFAIFIVGTLWNLLAPWPTSVWSAYWHVAGIGVPVFITFVTGIWFTWGGVRDIRNLFQGLGHKHTNHLDDGTVVNHQNLDEQHLMKEISGQAAPHPDQKPGNKSS